MPDFFPPDLDVWMFFDRTRDLTRE
jgi:hypothetical protein